MTTLGTVIHWSWGYTDVTVPGSAGTAQYSPVSAALGTYISRVVRGGLPRVCVGGPGGGEASKVNPNSPSILVQE